MRRVVIVGGGVLGTMHAVEARRMGLEVVHLDRDAEPRGATVRNLGMVWVSGRASGFELTNALRARELWASLGSWVPDIGFRADGSLTLAQHPAEVAVLEQYSERDDADQRSVRLLGPDEVRQVNPALKGDLLAGLWCTADAVVEPGHAMPAIRRWLASGGGYAFHPDRTAVAVKPGSVTDHTGAVHEGDVVVLCPGATRDGLFGELLHRSPIRHVLVQMAETEAFDERLTTCIADGDSLRYHPGLAVEAASALPGRDPVAEDLGLQLLVSQRAGGELTIGEAHTSDEPFDFATDARAERHLLGRLESLLGRPAPAVARRWTGVYAQCTDDRLWYTEAVEPGVVLVTGAGGRGMTLAPAIAEQTFLGLL